MIVPAEYLVGVSVPVWLQALASVPWWVGNWAFQNQAYALGIVLGYAVGIYYGFDGWSGSQKDQDFKDSPRINNLIWVVSGAVAAIFGDLHLLDPYADKGFLLVVYTLAFAVGSSLVVLGYAVLVAIDSFHFNRRFQGQYGFIDALSDYLFFGYRAYRETKAQIAAGLKSEFNAYYLEQLTYALLLASSEITDAARLSAARNVLRSATLITQRLRGASAPGTVRSNLMLARDYQAADDTRSGDQVVYLANDVQPKRVLALVAYDSDDTPSTLVLPLPGTDREIPVPGGPSVFVNGAPALVNDTETIEYPLSLDPAVKQQMQTYFADKQRTFRSFATLRIVVNGRRLGVLNVDCTETNVLGSGSEEQQQNLRYLLPFAAVLGSIYKDDKEFG